MEVHGDPPEWDPVRGRFDHAAGGERRPGLDGLAERDLLAAQLVQSPSEQAARSALRKGQPSTQER